MGMDSRVHLVFATVTIVFLALGVEASFAFVNQHLRNDQKYSYEDKNSQTEQFQSPFEASETYRLPTLKERFFEKVSDNAFEEVVQNYILNWPACENLLQGYASRVGANVTSPIIFLSSQICSYVLYTFLEPVFAPLKNFVLGRGKDYENVREVTNYRLKIPNIEDVVNFVTKKNDRYS